MATAATHFRQLPVPEPQSAVPVVPKSTRAITGACRVPLVSGSRTLGLPSRAVAKAPATEVMSNSHWKMG